ncbi:MAG TPA: Smr/MutS family protein [Rickettsiales bacterium]|nr:Smr/MutS family protein [Rickettsiales bacterium]
MFSKEDLEEWNNFKKKCRKSNNVDFSNITQNGKALLDKVKKSLKNKEVYSTNNESDVTSSNGFVLEKDSSLGIDSNSDRKLIQGKYQIDYSVDLHGFTINEAYLRIKSLFEKARVNNYKCILIITGKGLHSKDKTIKSSVIEWFKEPYFSSKIIKYTDAHKMHGGSGALYVLLRK